MALCSGGRGRFTFVVGGDEAQDVLVPQHHRLVDFCFPEPGAFLTGREDLHSHVTPTPSAAPHLPKAAFANDLLQDDRPSHGPLDKKWQTCQENGELKDGCREKMGVSSQQCGLVGRRLATNQQGVLVAKKASGVPADQWFANGWPRTSRVSW